MSAPTAQATAVRSCALAAAAASHEACRGDACAFWEPGGAVLEGRCMLERFLPAADWTPDLAAAWLRLRGELGHAAARRRTT